MVERSNWGERRRTATTSLRDELEQMGKESQGEATPREVLDSVQLKGIGRDDADGVALRMGRRRLMRSLGRTTECRQHRLPNEGWYRRRT